MSKSIGIAMIKSTLLLSLSFFLLVSCGHNLPDFTSRLSTRNPTEDKAEAIGEYALGCLKGAQTFTGQESGLTLSQLKRGRYWGHPDLINLLTRAGLEFNKMNKSLIIGDLSQSRGGPTITGHNSHQTGLDVDVWFKVLSSKDRLSLLRLETEEMTPLEALGEDQFTMIKFFAKDSSVERIFINPTFKRNLCLVKGEQRLTPDELHKMRAWWGHDDHIHVRLKCPVDSPQCISQAPIPPGDGCGEDLNWWFTEEGKKDSVSSWDEMKTAYLEKIKILPAQCSFYNDTF